MTDPLPDSTVVGRVARVDRGFAQVHIDDGSVSVATAGSALLVGDWVELDRALPTDSRIVGVRPRTSVLARQSADRSSAQQGLAANVDVVLVVEQAWPRPSMGRVERLLVLAWSSGAVPVVVTTKVDLHPDRNALIADLAAVAPGTDVVGVSAVTGEGLRRLGSLLGPGRTFVLLGPSGAGKSTLVNTLAGEPVVATGAVRDDGRGRHTTTHRELVTMPDGSVLIDTPGLRAVGVVGDADSVDCRFRDCAHDSEPGCEVSAAVVDGRLPQRRLDSWRTLQREVAYQQRRSDARASRNEKARWKAISKQMRGHNRP